MLVLSRNRGQSIIVDDLTQIKILAVHGNTVKIGIEADKAISIHREEIHKKIRLERQLEQQPAKTQPKIIYKRKLKMEIEK